MTNHVLLNNVDHKDLRVIGRRGAEFGDDVMFATSFPGEFRDLQAHYPIVFRKTDDGAGFEPVALFGFQQRENLFLTRDGWDAAYVPLAIERQPFLIGIRGDAPMVHIDLASPRVSHADGDAIFLAHGGNTQYLDKANSILRAIYEGVQMTPGFVAALLEHALLEAFIVDIAWHDCSQDRLTGFYTVNEETLAALTGEALDRLHRAGYLQAIYMQLASLSNLRALIARRNRRHATDS